MVSYMDNDLWNTQSDLVEKPQQSMVIYIVWECYDDVTVLSGHRLQPGFVVHYVLFGLGETSPKPLIQDLRRHFPAFCSTPSAGCTVVLTTILHRGLQWCCMFDGIEVQDVLTVTTRPALAIAYTTCTSLFECPSKMLTWMSSKFYVI